MDLLTILTSLPLLNILILVRKSQKAREHRTRRRLAGGGSIDSAPRQICPLNAIGLLFGTDATVALNVRPLPPGRGLKTGSSSPSRFFAASRLTAKGLAPVRLPPPVRRITEASGPRGPGRPLPAAAACSSRPSAHGLYRRGPAVATLGSILRSTVPNEWATLTPGNENAPARPAASLRFARRDKTRPRPRPGRRGRPRRHEPAGSTVQTPGGAAARPVRGAPPACPAPCGVARPAGRARERSGGAAWGGRGAAGRGGAEPGLAPRTQPPPTRHPLRLRARRLPARPPAASVATLKPFPTRRQDEAPPARSRTRAAAPVANAERVLPAVPPRWAGPLRRAGPWGEPWRCGGSRRLESCAGCRRGASPAEACSFTGARPPAAPRRPGRSHRRGWRASSGQTRAAATEWPPAAAHRVSRAPGCRRWGEGSPAAVGGSLLDAALRAQRPAGRPACRARGGGGGSGRVGSSRKVPSVKSEICGGLVLTAHAGGHGDKLCPVVVYFRLFLLESCFKFKTEKVIKRHFRTH